MQGLAEGFSMKNVLECHVLGDIKRKKSFPQWWPKANIKSQQSQWSDSSSNFVSSGMQTYGGDRLSGKRPRGNRKYALSKVFSLEENHTLHIDKAKETASTSQCRAAALISHSRRHNLPLEGTDGNQLPFLRKGLQLEDWTLGSIFSAVPLICNPLIFLSLPWQWWTGTDLKRWCYIKQPWPRVLQPLPLWKKGWFHRLGV